MDKKECVDQVCRKDINFNQAINQLLIVIIVTIHYIVYSIYSDNGF